MSVQIEDVFFFCFYCVQKSYVPAKLQYEAALKLDPQNSLVKSNLQKLKRAMASTAKGNASNT